MRGFPLCHSAEHFLLYSSVRRDQEKHTDHNTVKVCCLCHQVESFKSAFFAAESDSHQTSCCSVREASRIKDCCSTFSLFQFISKNNLKKKVQSPYQHAMKNQRVDYLTFVILTLRRIVLTGSRLPKIMFICN